MILELAQQADVNAADKDGLTPLHLAVQSKDVDIVLNAVITMPATKVESFQYTVLQQQDGGRTWT